jgi:hypothetical protein
MYISEILGYLSWPFMIVVSYYAVRWALRYHERKYLNEEPKEE